MQPELLPMLPELPEGFGFWFAGLTDGEGTFYIRAHERFHKRRGYYSHELDLRFEIKLRDDDHHVLDYIHRVLKCGKLFPRKDYSNDGCKRNPQTTFRVQRTSELLFVIVPIFNLYPLRTKKAREFVLWKEAAELRYESIMYRRISGRVRSRPLLSSTQWNRVKEISRIIREDIRTYGGKSKCQIPLL